MTRDELRLKIALTLYMCEKRRNERINERLRMSMTMEPWVEVRDIFLADAEEVLLLIDKPQGAPK